MKSILYVGATLMVAASIYGFVDYKQSHQKEAFQNMYSEKKEVAPTVVTDVTATEPEVKKEVTPNSKTKAYKKTTIQEDEFIPGIKLNSDDQKLKSTSKEISGKEDLTVVPAKEPNVIKKKKRKFNIKEFSRAPLRDDIDDEVLPPAKKGVKQL